MAENKITNQKEIRNLFSSLNIDNKIVNDGLEILDFLKHDNNFSIILMDADMPNNDGYEATKIIRKNKKYDNINIIGLSDNISQDKIQEMKNIGMQACLQKPLNINTLYDILKTYS